MTEHQTWKTKMLAVSIGDVPADQIFPLVVQCIDIARLFDESITLPSEEIARKELRRPDGLIDRDQRQIWGGLVASRLVDYGELADRWEEKNGGSKPV
jgi:hypothetical protein